MSSLSDNQFRIVVGLVAIGLAVVIIRLRFCYEPSLPPKPPKPRLDVAAVEKKARASDTVYLSYLEKDARAAGVATPTLADMQQKLAHRADDSGWKLAPGDAPLEVAGLRVRAITRKPEVGRTPILALEIHNPGPTAVAYRVDTRPTRGTRNCDKREAIPYHGLTLAAGETLIRGECIYKRGWALDISRIESIPLAPLAHYYVSKLPPVATNLEPRLARDHRAPGRTICPAAVPAAVLASLERGDTSWRDVIDFFARHRCETYKFPLGYKAFAKNAERPLPVAPD